MLFFKKDIQLWNLQKCDDDIQNHKKKLFNNFNDSNIEWRIT